MPKQENIIFVGDPHLDSRTPLSRLDNYEELTLIKLNKILQEAIKHDVGTVIFAGDMFDKDNYDQPLSYINKVIAEFKDYHNSGVQAYSVIGNHDLRHNKMEYFQNSPLNILFQTGYVKHLDTLDLPNIKIQGLDFTEINEVSSKIEQLNPEKINILTMHYATDNTIPNESISRKDLSGFNIVMAGHDHNYYEPTQTTVDTPLVLRPGSMIRRTRDQYNLEREPIIYLYKDNKVTPIVIAETKASEVFKSNVFTLVETHKSTNITQLFNEQYFMRQDLDLIEMVEHLPLTITPKAKETIKNYVISQGFTQQNK